MGFNIATPAAGYAAAPGSRGFPAIGLGILQVASAPIHISCIFVSAFLEAVAFGPLVGDWQQPTSGSAQLGDQPKPGAEGSLCGRLVGFQTAARAKPGPLGCSNLGSCLSSRPSSTGEAVVVSACLRSGAAAAECSRTPCRTSGTTDRTGTGIVTSEAGIGHGIVTSG